MAKQIARTSVKNEEEMLYNKCKNFKQNTTKLSNFHGEANSRYRFGGKCYNCEKKGHMGKKKSETSHKV